MNTYPSCKYESTQLLLDKLSPGEADTGGPSEASLKSIRHGGGAIEYE